MSHSKNFPTPPGGSITCEAGQFSRIKRDKGGNIHASCHTISPRSPGGPRTSGLLFSRVMDQELVERIIERAPEARNLITEVKNVLGVRNNHGFIPLYDFNVGICLVVGSDKSKILGGLTLSKALVVARSEYYQRPDGVEVWFQFDTWKDDEEPITIERTL